MDRTNFYQVLTTDRISELDFLQNSLSEFSIEYTPSLYRVVAADILSPDLISKKCYGSEMFWWLVLLFNGIENPFLDLIPGMVLKIPNKIDIYTFQRQFRLRRNSI